METLQIISDAIGNFGFPIVLSFILLYVIYREQAKHESEVDKLIEALNNNTIVMTELKAMVLDLKEMFTSLRAEFDDLKRGE